MRRNTLLSDYEVPSKYFTHSLLSSDIFCHGIFVDFVFMGLGKISGTAKQPPKRLGLFSKGPGTRCL
jgi:hypothetical protein